MSAPNPRSLPVDRLADRADDPAIQVVPFAGLTIEPSGSAGAEATREPHRHDYHELLWVRSGSGAHRIDDEPLPVLARSVTLIGRGQVHVFEEARDVRGAVVRFTEDLLHESGRGDHLNPGWLLAGRGGRTVPVPAGDVNGLEATIAALGAEVARPHDGRSADLERHLLMVLLLWLERWYDGGRGERRDAEDAEVQLHRRFAERLERDFAAHHDAAHYADALAVPPAALSKALADVTGRPTKELILDRVMLEAARLLRFSDRQVGEVAYEVGFSDPLYFSRAFKRHHGEAPQAFRDRSRGRTTERERGLTPLGEAAPPKGV